MNLNFLNSGIIRSHFVHHVSFIFIVFLLNCLFMNKIFLMVNLDDWHGFRTRLVFH